MTTTEQTFGDMSEQFDFEEDGMDYLDGPLSGWLRRKRDGAWFAYDCQPIITDRLWHWTLIPVPKKSDDVARVLTDAKKAKDGQLLSVVEDRRLAATSTCRAVSMENKMALPLLGSIGKR